MPKFDPQKIIQGAYDRIKLGSGLSGKLTAALIALYGVLAVAAYGLSGHVSALLFVVVAAIVVFLVFCGGMAFYAIKYPGLAVLEGADFIKLRQIEMSASDPRIMTAGPNSLPPPEGPLTDG
ncbi:hypothetical protein [Bosea sp. ASV33]|uniref:hypothetical protein n=1 Tax=Bosea sp. ASV33 TaxID=2795106 RepID=UPI0018EB57E2|nr:hypothetical protein [Bosea sp. ASV33]